MKNIILLFVLTIASLIAYAQDISDAKTYQEVKDLAIKNKKPIFLLIKSAILGNEAGYAVASKIIIDPSVMNLLKENFNVYETEYSSPTTQSFINIHKINKFPAFLFLHLSQDIFYAEYGYSTDKARYINMINKAISNSKNESIASLEEKYKINKSDTTTLKKIIQLKRKNGLIDNSILIEEYANFLKPEDYDNYQTVLYILEAGPLLDGNAYRKALNSPKFQLIYKQEPLEKRKEINNNIILNNYNDAVKNRNTNKAINVANFVKNSWGNDLASGIKAYEKRMLTYYLAINDTATYFSKAINHYDKYYMTKNVDSILKNNEKIKTETMEKLNSKTKGLDKAEFEKLKNQNPKAIITGVDFVSTPIPIHTEANELNMAAMRFYYTGTKNIDYLNKALIYSKRSIELLPSFINYNTLANIYYYLGKQQEAIVAQNKAIELVKKEKNTAQFLPSYIKTLEDIKANKLSIKK